MYKIKWKLNHLQSNTTLIKVVGVYIGSSGLLPVEVAVRSDQPADARGRLWWSHLLPTPVQVETDQAYSQPHIRRRGHCLSWYNPLTRLALASVASISTISWVKIRNRCKKKVCLGVCSFLMALETRELSYRKKKELWDEFENYTRKTFILFI